jgi:hypothetical protein
VHPTPRKYIPIYTGLLCHTNAHLSSSSCTSLFHSLLVSSHPKVTLEVTTAADVNITISCYTVQFGFDVKERGQCVAWMHLTHVMDP